MKFNFGDTGWGWNDRKADAVECRYIDYVNGNICYFGKGKCVNVKNFSIERPPQPRPLTPEERAERHAELDKELDKEMVEE